MITSARARFVRVSARKARLVLDQIRGKSVGDALGDLTRQYPDLKRHLYDDGGRLRAFVNVYVNDQDIRYLEKDNTPLTEGDSISIVPSIAGGRMTC